MLFLTYSSSYPTEFIRIWATSSTPTPIKQYPHRRSPFEQKRKKRMGTVRAVPAHSFVITRLNLSQDLGHPQPPSQTKLEDVSRPIGWGIGYLTDKRCNRLCAKVKSHLTQWGRFKTSRRREDSNLGANGLPLIAQLSEMHPMVTGLVFGATPKKVIIPNRHGEKLVGLLHDTGSPEIVVLCHGFRSSKEFKIMVNVSAALEKEGISAFRFDFSGNGESEGTFHYGHYQKEADDLRSVVEHFTSEKRRVVAILGHSKGGNVVLLYASRYHDVPNVVNVSGRYDMGRGIVERLGENCVDRIKKEGFLDVRNKAGDVEYRVTEESLMDRLNTDMHRACLQIDRGCRVFTVHGSNDEIIPVEDAFEFNEAIPNHELRIIEGASHDYKVHQDALASAVVSFVKEGRLPRN